jgi:hypothetical protein
MIFCDARSRAVRQRAGDPGCGEPAPPSILGKNFRLQSRRTTRYCRGPRAFTKLRDDEGVPLICPTCQVLLEASFQRLPATLHGVVFDIFSWELRLTSPDR